MNRFVSALRETAVWANQNHPKQRRAARAYSKIDPAVITRMARVRYGERLTPAILRRRHVAAKYGNFTSFPAQELIYAPTR